MGLFYREKWSDEAHVRKVNQSRIQVKRIQDLFATALTTHLLQDEFLKRFGSSRCGPAEMNPASIRKDAGSIPGLAQWVKDLAWLWYRPAATVPIRPLAWELPQTMGAALKKKKSAGTHQM